MAATRPTLVRIVIAVAFLLCVLVIIATVRSATSTSTVPSPSAGTGTVGTPPEDDVEVRVRNAGTVAFDDVRVTFSTDPEVNYGALAPGATSAYRVPPVRAYSIAVVHVMVEGRPLSFAPVDYVGAQTLRPGHYTYALKAAGEDRLDLTFTVDP